MLKPIKTGVLPVLLVLALAGTLIYAKIRGGAVQVMQQELNSLQGTKTQAADAVAAPDSLRKMFPAEAGVASFVEDLYVCAQRAGLKNHEIVTDQAADMDIKAFRRQKGPGPGRTKIVNEYSLRISAEGSYRQIAEYIRQIQNIDRFKKIAELELKPAAGSVSARITLKIFSLGAGHAA